jgi:hypothetical protein
MDSIFIYLMMEQVMKYHSMVITIFDLLDR